MLLIIMLHTGNNKLGKCKNTIQPRTNSFRERSNLSKKRLIESTIDTTIKTFEGGKYTDDVRACVYELLSLNFGVRNVAPVIRCVLSSLAHKSVDRLPSYGLTCQMILESLAVVQAQLGEALSETPGYTTLQSDGTTKWPTLYCTRCERFIDYILPWPSTSLFWGCKGYLGNIKRNS